MNAQSLFILVTTLLPLHLSSQNLKKKSMPEMIKQNDQLFMSDTEVSNDQYLSYTIELKLQFGLNSITYKNAIPDLLIWNSVYPNTKFIESNEYSDYPLVGVDIDQANSFCKWLKSKVNIDSNSECRLPSEKEWIASATKDYGAKTLKEVNKMTENGKYAQYNFNEKNLSKEIFTAPVYSYWPNKYGLYNMFGNVSEMTIEGVSKGGSYLDDKNSISKEYNRVISKPENALGFRCVCQSK